MIFNLELIHIVAAPGVKDVEDDGSATRGGAYEREDEAPAPCEQARTAVPGPARGGKHQRHVSKHGQQYPDLLEEVSTSVMSASTDSSTGTCLRR